MGGAEGIDQDREADLSMGDGRPSLGLCLKQWSGRQVVGLFKSRSAEGLA